MTGRDGPHVAIAGISSALGAALADILLREDGVSVSGSLRTSNDRVCALREMADPTRLELLTANLRDASERERFIDAAQRTAGEREAVLVYCGGRWLCGRLDDTELDDIEEVVEIGFTAPADLFRRFLRARRDASAPSRIVMVTGLGGERAGVGYSSIYGSITGAAYNLVRSLGCELAGTPNTCTAVVPGLFDKGQPYIHALCARLETARPTPLDEVAQLLATVVLMHGTALNGSVIEAGGGMFNYHDAARILAREGGASA